MTAKQAPEGALGCCPRGELRAGMIAKVQGVIFLACFRPG
jgi:hypothetical protein